MKGPDDIESFLIRLGVNYERLKPEMWNVRVSDRENMVISLAGPVLVFRTKVMDVPPPGSKVSREAFFESLLRLNTTELVHGAFGLEGTSIVISAALGMEDLDFSEFQAVIDDISLAVGKLYPQLSKFRA